MPNAPPASVRSNGIASSWTASVTLRTLSDDRRPQLFSMSGQRSAPRAQAAPAAELFDTAAGDVYLLPRSTDGEVEATAGGGAQALTARGKSELHRAGCWLTASRGDSQDSATE